MQQLRALTIFRPLNLLFLFVLQFLTYYFLNFDANLVSLLNVDFWILVVSTQLIAAAGYLINDHYDRTADEINKPYKMPIQHWKQNQIWIVYTVFNFLGICGGLFMDLNKQSLDTSLSAFHFLFIFSLIILGLWLYSFKLKQLPFIGNFVISAFAFVSIYIVYDVFEEQSLQLIVFFAALSALFTLLREVAKDIEDMHGDKLAGYRTFPVMSGFRASKSLLMSATVFTSVLYASFQYNFIGHLFNGNMLLVFVSYQLLCILLPLAFLLRMIYIAKSNYDMHQISLMFKYIMATGMLSMVFF